ncbi:hypothetical protein HNQ10_000773 [Deinococcus metallilatus]|uniref:Uncharacterized protein n=1 Tax=Deinococcus metallilatus TaxID=1211322 RepID=A0ABR6MPU8_9DEIO|nr:hypothetical protein [Deinococcus metallilatus]
MIAPAWQRQVPDVSGFWTLVLTRSGATGRIPASRGLVAPDAFVQAQSYP